MLRSKKGATFVSVVGTAVFITIIATLVFSFVGNNGLLVNKYASYNKDYSKTSDALTSAANYLVEKSSGEDINNVSIVNLVNTKLDLPGNFGIDEITDENITIVTKDESKGQMYKGKQIKLTREGFYINVFLSDDGTQKALSNIFFDDSISIDAAYKTGFLVSNYLYENGLFFYENGPVEKALNSSDNNKQSSGSMENDKMYQNLIPSGYKAPVYKKDEEGNFIRDEDYIDNKLIDLAIRHCMPHNNLPNTDNSDLKIYTITDSDINSYFTQSWSSSNTTFAANTVTYIKGDIDFSYPNVNYSVNTFEIKDGATVYVNGDFNMNHTPYKEQDGQIVYLPTTLKLGKNATLIVKGDIDIKNTIMMPSIDCGDGANIIAGGDITITGQQQPELTVNDHFYQWYHNGKKSYGKDEYGNRNSTYYGLYLGWKLLSGFLGDPDKYFEELGDQVRGKITGTIIAGNNFKVVTTDITGGIPPHTPVRATIYADSYIDLGDAILEFSGVSFLFADIVKFVGTGNQNLSTMVDSLLGNFKTEYLFVIVDSGVEYTGKTNSLKANIFTTNQSNTQEVVRQITETYDASSTSGNKIINGIFDWMGINQDIQKIGKDEINTDVSNLGLPKILTEGSTDQSYSSNVRK